MLNLFSQKRQLLIPIILCLVIGAVTILRLWKLDQYPSGFFTDEASIAYNAYTFVNYGVGEHGEHFPIYFKAFGEYKNPIYIYLLMPIFGLLGISIYNTRLLAALLLLAAAAIFGILLKGSTTDKRLGTTMALSGTLLFLGQPWTFQLGRVAFELASFPVFLIGAILCLRNFLHKKRFFSAEFFYWWMGFVICLGILFYSYTVARFLSPALFVLALAVSGKQLGIKKIVLSCLLFCCFLVPALVWEITHPGSLLARYQAVSSSITFFDFFINYLKNINPFFLFISGDNNLRHSVPGTGLFLLSTVPVFFVGLQQLLMNEHKQFKWWILGGLVLSPIPAALTAPSPHTLRSIGLLIFVTYILGLGVVTMVQAKKLRYFLAVITTLIAVEAIFFFQNYFSDYTKSSRIWFEADTVEALQFATKRGVQSHYYLSDKLYSGTYATAYFELAKKTHTDPIAIQTSVSTIPISRSRLLEIYSGAVLLTQKECQAFSEVISTDFTVDSSNDETCVISRRLW